MPVTRERRSTFVALFAILCAVLLWAASLPFADPDKMNNLGLLSILPITVYIALGILTISVCLVIYRQDVPEWVFLLHVAAYIIIIHATPVILYGTLRYSWAWKHVGVVDYIQRYGSVDPNITFLNAYHNWPGFFTLNALITDIAGFDYALVYAPWAQVFFNLVDMGALLIIFKTFTKDQRHIWFGIWLFFISNWVGQDYFAPQALSYFLYLIIIGISLRWFAHTVPPSRESLKRWLRFDLLVSLLLKGIGYQPQYPQLDTRVARYRRAGLMVMVILMSVVISTSHQITPLMVTVVFFTLVIFQTCNARSLPFIMLIITVVWFVYMATGFLSDNFSSLFNTLGNLSDNVDSNLMDLGSISPEQKLVSLMGRVLTAGMLVLGVLGGLRRLWYRHWDLPGILLTGVPFLIMAGNAYGGEMIFRVYLFALPFMSFFGAALIFPDTKSGKSRLMLPIMVLLSAGVLVGFLFAYYGKDRQYYFTENEVEAAQYLYTNAPDGSLLIEGTRNYPVQLMNYERFTYVTLSREKEPAQAEMLADPVVLFSRWLDNDSYAATYLIITRSHKIEVEMIGVMPPMALDIIEQTLLDSPLFTVIYQNEDAIIFSLTEDVEEAR